MSNVRVVAFAGELDASSKAHIERELGRIGHFGRGSVTIVDLTNVTFLDSTLLNALAHIRDDSFAGNPRGRVCIAVEHPYWRRLFHITEFDLLFPVFRTLAAARAYAHSTFPAPLFGTIDREEVPAE